MSKRLPLSFKQQSYPPVCVMTEWTVEGPEALAEALAWLYLRKEHHAVRVIHELDPRSASLPGQVIENAIKNLSVQLSDIADKLASLDAEVRKRAEAIRDSRVAHRDGLLFQHVSWIAAHLSLPNLKATSPHVRQADKGFDGVLLELDPKEAGLSRIVLCEDKASVNPRKLVTQHIWPEIKLIQAGEKDREILAALTAILDTIPELDPEAVIDATEWERARHFRVALTVDADQIGNGGYQQIFAGFEDATGGPIQARMAEVMPMVDVRSYLGELAGRVIDVLRTKRSHV